MGTVFVSYAREDRARVAPYVAALEKVGINVWIDHQDVSLSDDIITEISKGIESSKFGLIFYSARYEQKVWTKEEMTALIFTAIESGGHRKVIVVRLDDSTLPPLLAKRHWRCTDDPAQLAREIQCLSGVESTLAVPVDDRLEEECALAKPKEWPQLDGRVAEAIAASLVRDLHEIRRSTCESISRTIPVPGPAVAEITIWVPALTEASTDDLQVVLDVAETHRRFVSDYRRELAEEGLGKFTTAFRIQYEKKLEQLDAVRSEIAAYLKSFCTALEIRPLRG